MLGIFSRPFGSLGESDLQDLVEVCRVREHLHLDYKQDAYGHGHSDSVEMLADVTAMANAQGGYILIGVTEDPNEPDGTPDALVGIENGDQEATWMQSVCLSAIDEKISGLHIRDIHLSNGRSCVIAQIPNSLRKPHMVVHQRHRSFRIRHGRSKSFMGMQEVRSMIISMNQYRESLADFLGERKRKVRELAKGQPWLLLMATPIYVDGDKLDPLRTDLRNLLRQAPGNPDPSFRGIVTGVPRPRIFGVEANDPRPRIEPPPKRILRLFRNGHLEYCESYSDIVPEDWPESAMSIHSYRMTVTLLHFLRVARQTIELGEVSEPIAVTMHWENIGPSWLNVYQRGRPLEAFIWQDSTLTIDTARNDLSDPEEIARDMVDRLLNAYGYEDNPHFQENGEFVRWYS